MSDLHEELDALADEVAALRRELEVLAAKLEAAKAGEVLP